MMSRMPTTPRIAFVYWCVAWCTASAVFGSEANRWDLVAPAILAGVMASCALYVFDRLVTPQLDRLAYRGVR